MAAERNAGADALGKPQVEALAYRAEHSYGLEETLRRRGGRPALGRLPASAE